MQERCSEMIACWHVSESERKSRCCRRLSNGTASFPAQFITILSAIFRNTAENLFLKSTKTENREEYPEIIKFESAKQATLLGRFANFIKNLKC